MIKFITIISITLNLVFSPFSLLGESSVTEQTSSVVTQSLEEAEILPEVDSIQPGQPFWVAIRLNLDDNWHAYWKNPGHAGFPTSISWELPEGFQASEIHWPCPERHVTSSGISYIYRSTACLLAKILPPAELESGKEVEMKADVSWLVCSEDSCLPRQATLSFRLPISHLAPKENPDWSEFVKTDIQLPVKQENVQAVRNDQTIEVTLPASALSTSLSNRLQGAQFFPEHQVIDETEEPIIFQHPDKPGHYLLTMKALDGEPNDLLKGTLLLHSGEGSDREVAIWDIEAPIHHNKVQLTENKSHDFKGGLGLALLFAFIGGFILNFMPCVLPVISLKIFNFVQIAGENRRLVLKHSLLFTLGVVVSFWVLAGLLLLLQAYGHAVGWGFQMQEPLFVGILCAGILIFSLNFFGVFELGTSISSWAGQKESDHKSKQQGLFGSFLSGILATAMATPCSGPFLGASLGFAVTLSPEKALLIFTVLALGMSLPYLLLSAFPSLLQKFPKPGPWMVTFKEFMGFLMLTTALWLSWVFAAQTGIIAVFLLFAGLLFLSISCWIYGKWATPLRKRKVRTLGLCLAALFFILGGLVIKEAVTMKEVTNTQEMAGDWEPFSLERIISLQEQGVPVFIDFTAKWCLICQANHLVLSTPDVSKMMRENGVVKMKADWTKSDQAITQELKKFGRNSVPLYLLYGPDSSQPPTILPQVLTPEIVSNALEIHGLEVSR